MAYNTEIDYVAADAETDMPTPSDMAREQMSSMGLSAPSILSSRNETRTEEEVAADRQTLAEVAPGTGDILAVKNYPEDMSIAKEIISQGLDEGELSSVLGGVTLAGLATVGLLPSVTGVGAGAKVAKKAVKENLKKNLVKEFGDDGASKVVDTVGEASQPIKVTGVKPPKKTVKAYKLFKVNKKTGELYPLFVKMGDNKPIELNSWTKAEAGALNEKTGKVKSSLGDLAYRPGFHAGDLPIATHIGGKSGDVKKPNYRPDDQVWAEVEMSDDVDWQSVALQRARKKKDGTVDVKTAHITDQLPEGGHYRYKTNPNMTGNWLIGGELKVNRILTNDEVKSINDAAGVADLPRLSELNMAEGGTVPMKKQMEMFEPVTRGFDEGGLLDEGGTIDPVSGNDVPPGSTQEEVRDDIPAQLSEGEFVFPADVVRYIGLEKLMVMRQQAKMGLKMMEDMGQMGNSEEATMPDDLPFDINDLDMEDEIDDNNGLEMQVGGFVQAPQQQQNQFGISGYQTAAAPTTSFTSYTPPPIPTTPIQQAPIPGAQFVPTRVQDVVPTFQEAVGSNIPGVDFEYVDYINDAGQTIKLRKSKADGSLLDPIPEGYRLKTEEVTPSATAPTTAPTTRTQPEGGDEEKVDDGMGPGGGRVALGGTVNNEGLVDGSTQFGVSFDNMGGVQGVIGATKTAFGLATGKPIPETARATLTRNNVSVTITGSAYNQLKQNNFRGELADKIQEDHTLASRVSQAEEDALKAQKAKDRAKDANAKANAEEARLSAELSKFGNFDTSNMTASQIQAEINKQVVEQRKRNAAARAANTHRTYESDRGEGRDDYSFSDYSSNVARGTEDRGYGAAYDSDVLGLDE